MFDYNLLHWATFLATAVLLNLAPGPDMAFIVGHTIRGGRLAGFVAIGGIWTGTFGHVLLAAAGLSTIMVTSAVVFTTVKWAGAAYLFWLGIKALRSSSGTPFKPGHVATSVPPTKIFRQGVGLRFSIQKSPCSFWRSCPSSSCQLPALPEHSSSCMVCSSSLSRL